MKFSVLFGAATAAALLALSAVQPAEARGRPSPSATLADNTLANAIEEAIDDTDRGDFAAAYLVLEKATALQAFEKSPPEVQRGIWLWMAQAAIKTRDWPKAKAAALRATASPNAGADEWTTRLEAAYRGNDKAEITTALTTIAQRFPEALGNYTDSAIASWMRQALLTEDGGDAAVTLSQALLQNWKPGNPFFDLAPVRRSLIETLLARGQTDQALAQARLIDDPTMIIGMRADKRYDALTRAHPELFSPRAVNVARLARIQALVKDNPKRLSGQSALALALLDLDRSSEARAGVEAAIATAKADPEAFVDTKEQLSWAIYAQRKTLAWDGRHEEALEALEIAARIPEHGAANVSQTLNLAASQVQLGRSKAALTTARSVSAEGSSPYGRSVALWVITCANVQLGDTAGADAAIGELRKLGREGVGNLYVALLCRDDLDGAAALTIDRLKDPNRRFDTLLGFQDVPPDPHPTPLDLANRAREKQLLQRADVKAAIDAVGRILAYAPEDLQPPPPAQAPAPAKGKAR